MRVFETYEKIFAKRADAYHAAMERYPHARAREFELVVEHADLSDGQTVCDAPAGGGYLRPYIRNADIRYVAIDCANYFFDRCPADGKNERHYGTLTAIPLPDASVDRVINLAGIHHEPCKLDVFREYCRILKPGGLFVLADAEEGSPADAFLNIFVDQSNSMGHKGEFLNAESREEMGRAGFDIRQDRQITYPWSFESEQAMAAFCKSLFGLDLASESAVVEGIGQYLGSCQGPGKVNLAWALSYITCIRPQ